MELSRKRDRERLKARHAPYWHRLAKGRYIGFQRGAETWHARFRDRDGNQKRQELVGAVEFDAARTLAEAWFEQMGSAVVRTVRRGTVRQALEHYLKWLRDQGRAAAATTAEQRFAGIVWGDPVASITLQSLTRDDFSDWRERLKGF
ncbi:MAG: hypothetical protein NT024_00770, partial [Proteobacteria bacterium]|nr:hypothetical protein [Pseudomonadota bacterium]